MMEQIRKMEKVGIYDIQKVMSKNYDTYDLMAIEEIIRTICSHINYIAEGFDARYDLDIVIRSIRCCEDFILYDECFDECKDNGVFQLLRCETESDAHEHFTGVLENWQFILNII